jgi:hypothetical protein
MMTPREKRKAEIRSAVTGVHVIETESGWEVRLLAPSAGEVFRDRADAIACARLVALAAKKDVWDHKATGITTDCRDTPAGAIG